MQVVHGRWPYGNENIKKQENEYNEMIEVSEYSGIGMQPDIFGHIEIILSSLEKKDDN